MYLLTVWNVILLQIKPLAMPPVAMKCWSCLTITLKCSWAHSHKIKAKHLQRGQATSVTLVVFCLFSESFIPDEMKTILSKIHFSHVDLENIFPQMHGDHQDIFGKCQLDFVFFWVSSGSGFRTPMEAWCPICSCC